MLFDNFIAAESALLWGAFVIAVIMGAVVEVTGLKGAFLLVGAGLQRGAAGVVVLILDGACGEEPACVLVGPLVGEGPQRVAEIGRASCMERV